jgi:tryptophanyl-tRNA synthetase
VVPSLSRQSTRFFLYILSAVFSIGIMRILSGIQPSGLFHLGNYFAMIKRMIELQEKADLYMFIASYHAITTVTDGKVLSGNIRTAAVDLLALGVDPDKTVFWVQSDVPEVNELAWLLSTSITVPQLELAHSYKDKITAGTIPTAGLFSYPVLMSADILLFGAQKIPVGKDQKQHLEMAREICRKFNHHYGETFVMPEPDIMETAALVPGTDGRKMSKSYNNHIYVFAEGKELKKKVGSIITDSAEVDDPKNPDGAPLFDIYALFLNEDEREDLKKRFRTPGEGYGHIKADLIKKMEEYFDPFRKKREDLLSHPDDVRDILKAGAAKARLTAGKYLELAREKTGLIY